MRMRKKCTHSSRTAYGTDGLARRPIRPDYGHSVHGRINAGSWKLVSGGIAVRELKVKGLSPSKKKGLRKRVRRCGWVVCRAGLEPAPRASACSDLFSILILENASAKADDYERFA